MRARPVDRTPGPTRPDGRRLLRSPLHRRDGDGPRGGSAGAGGWSLGALDDDGLRGCRSARRSTCCRPSSTTSTTRPTSPPGSPHHRPRRRGRIRGPGCRPPGAPGHQRLWSSTARDHLPLPSPPAACCSSAWRCGRRPPRRLAALLAGADGRLDSAAGKLAHADTARWPCGDRPGRAPRRGRRPNPTGTESMLVHRAPPPGPRWTLAARFATLAAARMSERVGGRPRSPLLEVGRAVPIAVSSPSCTGPGPRCARRPLGRRGAPGRRGPGAGRRGRLLGGTRLRGRWPASVPPTGWSPSPQRSGQKDWMATCRRRASPRRWLPPDG